MAWKKEECDLAGTDPNGANLTGFWDFRERLAPADAGDGFEDESLSNFPHFPDGFLQAFVIVDGFRHLCRLLF